MNIKILNRNYLGKPKLKSFHYNKTINKHKM